MADSPQRNRGKLEESSWHSKRLQTVSQVERHMYTECAPTAIDAKGLLSKGHDILGMRLSSHNLDLARVSRVSNRRVYRVFRSAMRVKPSSSKAVSKSRAEALSTAGRCASRKALLFHPCLITF